MGLFTSLFGGADTKLLSTAIKEGAFLVDVRTPQEFQEGSVRGAVNIPLGSISGHLDKFKGHKRIIVFCRSGSRSAEAKSVLERNGFHNVINGGTWQNVDLSVIK